MMQPRINIVVKTIIIFIVFIIPGVLCNWEEWWTYDGISGPDFWGLINPNWQMCEKGRRQSPVNVEPSHLVYDPHLRRMHVDKHRITGTLYNTGQSVIFRVEGESKHPINISGGPLVYKYRFEELYIHFGTVNGKGSEHQINGHNFPAEIQLYGYNAELYHNMSEARLGSNGIVGIAVMAQISSTGNDELRILASGFSKITYRGDKYQIHHLSLAGLLPETDHFMTYDGSTTYPGCWETATWLILNKPIYITHQELFSLRQLMQGDVDLPKAKIANNFRPVRAVHHRTVRTNIDFTNSQHSKNCPSMHREMYYGATAWPKR